MAHLDHAEKDPGIPPIAEATACNCLGCPGVEGFAQGYGLAGGGMGPYVYCDACGEVRGKDLDDNA